MARQMAVVLSQGQSNNPAKRRLEETIVAELMMDARLRRDRWFRICMI